MKKIIAYCTLGIVTFIISLLYLPFELFLLSTIVVLVALRGVEKELGGFNVRSLKTFDPRLTKTK